MDGALLAQGIRVTTAAVGLAVATVLDLADQFADRLDPPPLDGYAGFDSDVRLRDLPPLAKARAREERP